MAFNTLVVAFVAACLTRPTVAIESRAGSVCSSGIYGELVPILAPYSVAQAFCTAIYPVKCTTQLNKRATPTTTASNRQPSTTTTTKSSTLTTKSTTAVDPKASAWAKAQLQAGQVVSTLCSCLQGPAKACPSMSKTSSSSITTSKRTTSTTTSTKKPSSTTTSTQPSTTSTTRSTTMSSTSSTTRSTTTSSSTTSAIDPCSTPHTVNAPICNLATVEDDNGGCIDQCTCTLSVDGNAYCAQSNPGQIGCDCNGYCAEGDFCSAISAECNSIQPYSEGDNVCSLQPAKRKLARSIILS